MALLFPRIFRRGEEERHKMMLFNNGKLITEIYYRVIILTVVLFHFF